MLWPVRIHAHFPPWPWSGEQPDLGLYSPMDPRSIEGTFPVSDATYCEGLRICNGAPDEVGQTAKYGANSKHGQRVATAKSCCYGGLRHSIKLYSPRMPTDWNCRGQTDPAIKAAVKADVPIKLSPGK